MTISVFPRFVEKEQQGDWCTLLPDGDCAVDLGNEIMEQTMQHFIPSDVKTLAQREIQQEQWATCELARALLDGKNYRYGTELKNTKKVSSTEFCGDM